VAQPGFGGRVDTKGLGRGWKSPSEPAGFRGRDQVGIWGSARSCKTHRHTIYSYGITSSQLEITE